ncbi:MAG TPA: hypothetical protein VLE53_19070 [Gemmatimonadaceae bacterium]|nr:hypothetical protein [Gemmatimonadaceae bacterium]
MSRGVSARKRVLLAWSSGKDSAWALHRLRDDPTLELAGLLTTLNAAADRVAMHGVRRELLEAQAAALGLALFPVHLPSPCSNEAYERLMADAMRVAREHGVTHVAFGDLFLEDVRAYRIRSLSGTGIEPLFPIWCSAADTPALARQMVSAGVRAVITCVDTQQLPSSFLGREFSAELLRDLPPSVDPCGERGEFHTFCYAGPAFDVPLRVTTGETVAREGFEFIDVVPEGTRARS